MPNQLAIITGASSGIGYQLARLAAADHFDLLLAADDQRINEVANEFVRAGHNARGMVVDLATPGGVEAVIAAAGDQPIDVLCANAGRGLSGALTDLDDSEWQHVIETNIVGTTYLLKLAAQRMQSRGAGKILVTGSIAGLAPGPFEQVYSGSKAYLNSIAHSLREELRESGVSVTVLMPAATDTRIFERGHYETTKLANGPLADPAEVARDGWRAMMAGDSQIISADRARKKAAEMSSKDPDQLAREHVLIARPGSANE